MARQCTQPKRPRNAIWFKEKAMLAEAQESGQILDEEQLAFLADPEIIDSPDKAQRIKPTLYDGSVISRQHDVILVTDEEETLILEEVSRSKMLAKQNDPISKEKKIKQDFWLQTSHLNTDQSDISPVKIKPPRELRLVNTSLKKLKYHLGKFDTVVKKRITSDTITKDS
ncbi:hypothetical protein Tco_1129142 [Tanacetum coccineum]